VDAKVLAGGGLEKRRRNEEERKTKLLSISPVFCYSLYLTLSLARLLIFFSYRP
jgi:hypothetical protein